jgi:hypothetical protein
MVEHTSTKNDARSILNVEYGSFYSGNAAVTTKALMDQMFVLYNSFSTWAGFQQNNKKYHLIFEVKKLWSSPS